MEFLFKCPNCSMHLCVSDEDISKSCNCPTCQANMTIPAPDFTFTCPTCSGKLLTINVMRNEDAQCPLCSNKLTIPAVGQKYVRPLRTKPKTVKCSSCSTDLEVDGTTLKDMAGQTLACPICSAKITLPDLQPSKHSVPADLTSLFAKPAQQQTVSSASQAQHLASHSTPECSHCKQPMPENTVVCISCGFDRRTGQKVNTDEIEAPQKKSKLKLQEKQETTPLDHPAWTTYKKPVFNTTQHIIGIAKKIALWLIAPIVILAALLLFDAGRSETKEWKTACDALDSLKKTPADQTALKTIADTVPRLSNNRMGRSPKAGLISVYALGQIHLGNTKVGLNACKLIEKNYADSKFVSMVASTNFTETCQKCNGAELPCPNCARNGLCKGCNGKKLSCPTCKGQGSTTITFPSKQANLKLMDTGKNIRRLGGPTLTNPNTSTTQTKKCTACMGAGTIACRTCNDTGKCTTCQGTGKSSSPCTKCQGQGTVIAESRLFTVYLDAIKKAHQAVFIKLWCERILDPGRYIRRDTHQEPPESRPIDEIISTTTETTQTTETTNNATAKAIDWDKRYQELYQLQADKFVAPKIDQLISLRMEGGNIQEGILISLTESNLGLRLKNMDATIEVQKTQLDPESQRRCFRNEFADFQARKECEKEKAKQAKGIFNHSK